MGKRKAGGVKEICELDKETTVFINCRKYNGMTQKAIKGHVESFGFSVKLIKKTLKQRHALVDVGSVEEAKKLIEKLNLKTFKGHIVIADFMRKDKKVDENPKNIETLSILDRLLCMRGVSKFVSRKTIACIFKDAESIIIPSHRGTELRDILLVFRKPSQLSKAVKEYRGWEIGGKKLNLETLVAIPAEVKEGNLDDDDDEVVEKKVKVNKRLEDDDEDDDNDDEEMEDNNEEEDNDSNDEEEDNDSNDEEDNDEEEIVQPPKKIQRKK